MMDDKWDRWAFVIVITMCIFTVLGAGFFTAGDSWHIAVLSNVGIGLWIAAGVTFVVFLFIVAYVALEDK